jgi:hypothetical protein
MSRPPLFPTIRPLSTLSEDVHGLYWNVKKEVIMNMENERNAALSILRRWHFEDNRRAWRASIRGFFVRLIVFGTLGLLVIVAAVLQEL